jgi:hypothetical protein
MAPPESDRYAEGGASDWEVRPAVPGWSAGQDYTGPLFDDTAGISICLTSTGLGAAPTVIGLGATMTITTAAAEAPRAGKIDKPSSPGTGPLPTPPPDRSRPINAPGPVGGTSSSRLMCERRPTNEAGRPDGMLAASDPVTMRRHDLVAARIPAAGDEPARHQRGQGHGSRASDGPTSRAIRRLIRPATRRLAMTRRLAGDPGTSRCGHSNDLSTSRPVTTRRRCSSGLL